MQSSSVTQTKLLVAGVTIGLASLTIAAVLLLSANKPSEPPTVIQNPSDIHQAALR